MFTVFCETAMSSTLWRSCRQQSTSKVCICQDVFRLTINNNDSIFTLPVLLRFAQLFLLSFQKNKSSVMTIYSRYNAIQLPIIALQFCSRIVDFVRSLGSTYSNDSQKSIRVILYSCNCLVYSKRS